MPAPFTVDLSTRIVFAPGAVERLGEEARAIGGGAARVLLVTDRGVERAGLVAPALAALAAAGIPAEAFADVRSDPLSAEVDAAAARARGFGATIIAGLGGGSALDVAKLAAAVAAGEAPAAAYAAMATDLPARPLPIIAIPTTAGTGAEVTRTAVFTLDSGAKVWAWGEGLRPRVALLDPALTAALPAGLTAATGIDALVHAIEASTNRRANPVSGAWGHEAVRLVAAHLPRALAGPADLEARGGLMLAAALAGLAIDTSGTAVAHAFGHALGTLAHVHHGRAVGLSLRVAIAGNAAAGPARHRAIAEALGVAAGDLGPERLPAALAAAYDGLLRRAGLPVSLAADGLAPGDAERLADTALLPENRPMVEATARPLDRPAMVAMARALLEAV